MARTSGGIYVERNMSNPIINGGMDIWQRGITASYAGTGTGGYVADRWLVINNCDATLSVNQDATSLPPISAQVPAAVAAMSVKAGTPDTALAANQYAYVTQKLEGFIWAPYWQKQFTIGFWVRSHIPGIYSLGVWNGDGSANARACVNEYTIAAGEVDTWVYRTITFPASPATGTWNLTTSVGAWILWTIAGTGTAVSTPSLNTWNADGKFMSANQVNGVNTAFDFRIWGVTMGLGPTVAPYWPRPIAQELILCQRYYEQFGSGIANEQFGAGFQSGPTIAYVYTQWQVLKRATPSITYSAPSTMGIDNGSGSFFFATAISAIRPSRLQTMTQVTVASGLTAKGGTIMYDGGAGTAFIKADAEL